MNDAIKIIILAIVGGIIGYITNVIAIKLIFRPIVPIHIPIINKQIIGLIPKRKAEIASNIGQIIQDEFISIDEILKNLITYEDKEQITEYIKIKIKLIINEKMSFIPIPIKSIVQDYISEVIEEELRQSIDDLSEELIEKSARRINIQKIVEDKINELDLYELEKIILRVAKNELKHIEILGLILGLAIGLVQGLIIIAI